MCDEIEASIPRFGVAGQRQKLYLAPRKTYKTSLIAAALAYAFLKFPNIRCALGRGTHQLAKDILGEVKQHLKSPVILDVWGDLERDALIWNAESITIGHRDRAYKEPTVQTFGLDVSLTGQHFDWIVGDDFVNETNYSSGKWMVKARVVVQGFYPILEEHGSMLLTGTRWGANDLYGWLLRQDDELEEVGEPRNWSRYIRGAFDGPDGYFFPAVITDQFLADMRKKTEDKLFTSWYLNQTHVEGQKLFTSFPAFIADYYAKPFPCLVIEEGDVERTIPLYVSMTIDSALTTPLTINESDLLGYTVVGTDADDMWWTLEADGFRKIPSDQASTLLYAIRTYLPDVVCVENAGADVGFMARLSEGINDINEACNVKISLITYQATRDEARGLRGKVQRIENLQPRFKQDKVRFRKGKCRALIQELDDWPNPDHDDVADAFAQQRIVAKPATQKMMEHKRDIDEEAEELWSYGKSGKPTVERKQSTYSLGKGSPTYA
jgi:hypothetical protein